MDLLSVIPHDHARQVQATYFVPLVIERGRPIERIMDFGCGNGGSADYFEDVLPHAGWIGLDIVDSSEIRQRAGCASGRSFCTYNGTLIPFADSAFDLIYSNQVFEHVRRPGEVLPEIERVLQSGGHGALR